MLLSLYFQLPVLKTSSYFVTELSVIDPSLTPVSIGRLTSRPFPVLRGFQPAPLQQSKITIEDYLDTGLTVNLLSDPSPAFCAKFEPW